MSDETAIVLSIPRIEMYASPTGTGIIYCSKCKENTYEGQFICCEWALGMFNRYFKGENDDVADSPIH